MEKLAVISETIYYIVISLAALAGGFFSLMQWHKQIKLRKAELLENMMNSLLNDKDIVEVVYTVEYNPYWYEDKKGKDVFHNTEFEKKMDKTLIRYSYFAYLCDNKLIESNEFDFVKYTIDRLLKNKQVQKYLSFLIVFCKSQNVFFPHASLLNYGKKTGIL